ARTCRDAADDARRSYARRRTSRYFFALDWRCAHRPWPLDTDGGSHCRAGFAARTDAAPSGPTGRSLGDPEHCVDLARTLLARSERVRPRRRFTLRDLGLR